MKGETEILERRERNVDKFYKQIHFCLLRRLKKLKSGKIITFFMETVSENPSTTHRKKPLFSKKNTKA
jgi:hypothetical protein